jgi:hypothetical protein
MAGLFATEPEELQRIAARSKWAIDPNGAGPADESVPLGRFAMLGLGDEGPPTLLAQAVSPLERSSDASSDNSGRPSETTYRTVSGDATYYDLPGNTTASGEPFDANRLTAAMTRDRLKTFGTEVIVRLADNPQRSIRVKVNDRGPFERGPDNKPLRPLRADPKTISDLTPEAFKQLAGDKKIGRIKVEVLIPDRS